jgi:hypothetical protein
LRAIAIQDRVFLAGRYLDKSYKTGRKRVFIISVNCGQAGGTCFCVSMDAGPKIEAGYYLALRELAEDRRHIFVLEIGSSPNYRTGVQAKPRSPLPSGSLPEPRLGWAAASTPTGSRNCCGPTPTTMGRGCRTVPDLRQLHECLTDLFLHDDR